MKEFWFNWAQSKNYIDIFEGDFLYICQLHTIEQNLDHHPEGNVENHTRLVMDIINKEPLEPKDKFILMMTALLHDIGKIKCTELKDGKIISPGHAKIGGEMAIEFFNFYNIDIVDVDIQKIIKLIEFHLYHINFKYTHNKIKFITKLKRKLYPATIDELIILINADVNGRGKDARSSHLETIESFKKLASEIVIDNKNEIKPILMGRHLIDKRLKPSVHFTKILNNAIDAQINNRFIDIDSALIWLDEYLNNYNYQTLT